MMNRLASFRRIFGAPLTTLPLVFAAAPALAEEPAPAASSAPSAQEAELRALRGQGDIEEARERNRQDAERRHERRELERAKYEADVARYRRMRDTYMESPGVDARERSTRDALMDRRLFVPDLVGFGVSWPGLSGLGGLGGLGGGLLSGTAVTGSQHALAFTIGPNVDVRVGERLTVGGSVTFSRSRSEGFASTALRVHPRLGVLVPVGPLILWPRIGPTVGVSEGDAFDGGSLGAAMEVGLVFPLTSRVFLQATPAVTYTHTWYASSEADLLGVGVRTGLGVAF